VREKAKRARVKELGADVYKTKYYKGTYLKK
jgi:hypothetical protein